MALNRGWCYRATVPAADDGRRLIDYLATYFTHSSRAEWLARLAAGEVTVDDGPAVADAPLRRGQGVAWQRPPWDEPDVPLTFEVVHEDDELLIVAKPSGLPTMPAGGFLEHTLLHLVHASHPGARPLHRLGRFTSGVIVFARDHHAAATLSRAWRDHAVEKDYRALVDGTPAWAVLDVTTAIGPVPHPRLGTIHAATNSGRPAHSRLTAIEPRAGHTLLEVRITTGRPHQIRIHCAAAGHPLVDDPVYAPGGRPRLVDPGLPGDGGYLLHAHRVRFRHPARGTALTVEAPLPPPLRTATER